MWGSMGEVWKSVGGECGSCFEVGESVLGCGEVWGSQHTLLHLTPHPPHSPDIFSTLIQYLSPAPPHSRGTSLHTFPHSPPTSPHPSHLSFTSPNTFPHNPHASSNTSLCSPYCIIYPMPKFLTFLIYCQITLKIKYARNSLKISHKFLKQK